MKVEANSLPATPAPELQERRANRQHTHEPEDAGSSRGIAFLLLGVGVGLVQVAWVVLLVLALVRLSAFLL